MTPEQKADVASLLIEGHTPMSAARCFSGISYLEILEEFPDAAPKHKPSKPPALWDWWIKQPWVWRPDNQNPIEAPWERIVK